MPTVTKQRLPASVARPTEAAANGRSAWGLAAGVKLLLYGQSGTGKTTLWATFPGPILALVCSGGRQPGELRSIDTPEYRRKIDARIVTDTDTLRRDLEEAGRFATVVLDHASGLQDLVLKELLGLDEVPVGKSWGLASQQQYGQVALQCKEIFRTLLSLPGHCVFVAQERTFGGREETGSDVIAPTVGAALMPSLTGWLNPACDYVAQTFKRPRFIDGPQEVGGKTVTLRTRGRGVEYCLRTEPHEVYQTKFRVPKGRVLPEVIVDPTFAKIQALIQGKDA